MRAIVRRARMPLIGVLLLPMLLAGCDLLLGAVPGRPMELARSTWSAVAIGSEPIPPGSVRLDFVTESDARPDTGCNRLSARYTVSGAEIRFTELSATRKACAGNPGRWETALMGALEATRGWAVAGEQLQLTDADGNELAVFERVTGPGADPPERV